jgi:hypothetical protein
LRRFAMNKPLNMPIAPSATIRHKIAFRNQGNFALTDTVHVISTHNPWRPKSRAWNLFEFVLRPKLVTTVGEILDEANAIGYNRAEVMQHIRWLYTWGDFIEINGRRYFPKQAPIAGE